MEAMFPHHKTAIERVTAALRDELDILAVLLGGSIAHGFAGENSDVDIMIVVSDDEHRRRFTGGSLNYYRGDLTNYEGGYVDGKFLSPSFLAEVEHRGSEPARFAFADAQVLFSRIDGLPEQVARIARYPVEERGERIRRFHAQLNGWLWYSGEAQKRGDSYLMGIAATRILLFGGRMVLAHNELLYPYHKWFFRVLEGAADKPAGLLNAMRQLSREQTPANISAFRELLFSHRTWEIDDAPWPNRFMIDSELTWMRDSSAIDDI